LIYQADNLDAAERALAAFAAGSWGQRFPTIAESWRRHWTHIIPFFAFAAPVRTILYTTNAIESLHTAARAQNDSQQRGNGDIPNFKSLALSPPQGTSAYFKLISKIIFMGVP
jgi:Transposase, Mutator family